MVTANEVKQRLAQLDQLIADDLEDEQLEFKPWNPDIKKLKKQIYEYVVCFANARGGTLVIGVHDQVRGRKNAIHGIGGIDLALLKRDIYGGTDPPILVELEELVEPEGRLLLVHVPQGIPPHTTAEGLAKIRVGKDCQPLKGTALAQLLVRAGQWDFSAQALEGITLDDLDEKQFDLLRETIRREAQNARLSALPSRELADALQLTIGDKVSAAAVLLLGKPQVLGRVAPQHEVKWLRHIPRRSTQYDQRRDLRGPLLQVLSDMEGLLSPLMRIRTIQEEGFGQLEVPDLSWEVAREAVLNAVTHRDYFQHQGVQVDLYADRLEISSPGGFIGGITPQNILRHPPAHRNELLARAFQSMGLVNRAGLGVDRMYEGLLKLGKALPRYVADEQHVRLTIPLGTHDGFALLVAEEERRGRDLDLEDLLILRALLHQPTLDRWGAGATLQLSPEEAAKRLVSLRERGYLASRGRGRGTAYTLRRSLAERLRGRTAVDSEIPLDEEGVKLRIATLLKQRGRLTNAEIRAFSGFSRTQVNRLVRDLVNMGQARIEGRGRGAHVVPS